jgi:hypothetical protein
MECLELNHVGQLAKSVDILWKNRAIEEGIRRDEQEKEQSCIK